MADVATRSLFRIQVVVVLRSGRLEHWRTEVRGIFKRLGEGVVRQEAETA